MSCKEQNVTWLPSIEEKGKDQKNLSVKIEILSPNPPLPARTKGFNKKEQTIRIFFPNNNV